MDPVPTHYIDRDGAALAYQVVGDGPVDVVLVAEFVMHLDLCWTDPDIHHIFERAAGYSRTILMQPRGFGLSDRITYAATVEQQADDVMAVMNAVGMSRATLVGMLGTCGGVALVAARAPERVNGLVLLNPLSQGVRSSEELHGWTPADVSRYLEGYGHAIEKWGSGQIIEMWDPVQATPFNRRLMALLERSSTTPAAALAYFEWIQRIDIQDVLRSVRVPTRVLGLQSTPLPEAAVGYVAELVPGAELHQLPRTPPGSSIGQAFVPAADHIEEMATGTSRSADANRFLGTVLFTDVVSSTELLARVGDAKYRELRADHERLVRLAVETVGGALINVSGDGTLSLFEGPGKAVRCAETICREAEETGIAVRCGVHTGELERDSVNITGMTVHIGARVGAAAGPGEVLVSRTVHDLVVGSGLTFQTRGEQELKGIPGQWELFAVTSAGEQAGRLPAEKSLQTSMDKMALGSARRVPALSRAALRMANAFERRRAGAGRT
jgi:class 3 adenylate cyclase/pimeloyl-ACP methyl ester carboxylesterase